LIADPICTILFAVLVCFTAAKTTKNILLVLMEATPPGIKMDDLYDDILNIKGTQSLHDLHVWSLSSNKISLSAHITSNNPAVTLKKTQKLF